MIKKYSTAEKAALYLTILAVSIIIVGATIFITNGSWKLSSTLNETIVGQFGDFVGGLSGTLIGLVGIILYYSALKEQRKDIKISQESLSFQVKALNQQITEFQAQNEELTLTRRIYEQQSKTMRTQQFETHFYALLNLSNTIRESLNRSSESTDFAKPLYDRLIELSEIQPNDSFQISRAKSREAYNKLHLDPSQNIGKHFRTIHEIVRMINECDYLDNIDQYSSILKSQISDSEILLLYYHYGSQFGIQPNIVLKLRILSELPRYRKIEFQSLLKKCTVSELIQLHEFENWLSLFLARGFQTAKSLESLTPFEEELLYSKFEIFVRLVIDRNLKLTITIPKNNKMVIGNDDFKELIERHLYDFQFTGVFAEPRYDELHINVIAHVTSTQASYILNV